MNRNRIVTLKEALMLRKQGYDMPCNNWYRFNLDNKLYKNQSGFSDNSNRHRLSAPRILEIKTWLTTCRFISLDMQPDIVNFQRDFPNYQNAIFSAFNI